MSDIDETQTDAATEPADNAEPQIGEIGTGEDDSDETGEDQDAGTDEG